ncbi:MAG TPA: hypothetical protein PLA90_07540 [Candidatus Sumerlaeota bacterium]|nr:hypothetical protein [Candidatus Sumerlaeota bacterium]
MKTTNEQNAEDEFDDRLEKVESLLCEIMAKVQRETKRENITWANAGSMAHVQELLQVVNNFMD